MYYVVIGSKLTTKTFSPSIHSTVARKIKVSLQDFVLFSVHNSEITDCTEVQNCIRLIDPWVCLLKLQSGLENLRRKRDILSWFIRRKKNKNEVLHSRHFVSDEDLFSDCFKCVGRNELFAIRKTNLSHHSLIFTLVVRNRSVKK